MSTKPGLYTGEDIYIDDVLLNTINSDWVAWVVTDLDGWWGLPDVEVPDDVRPFSQDGSYYTTGRFNSRTINLTGHILPLDGVASKGTAARDAFNRALSFLVRKRATLKVKDGANFKTSLVQLSGKPLINVSAATGFLSFSIPLKATDPLKYSEGLKYSDIGLASGTTGRTYNRSFNFTYGGPATSNTIVVTNDGSYAAFPEFTITGPVVDPRVEHLESGQFLDFKTTVESGYPLEIKPLTKQVLVNGSNARNTLSPRSKWFPLYPGDNTLRFTGSQHVPSRSEMSPQRNLATNPVPEDNSAPVLTSTLRRNLSLTPKPTVANQSLFSSGGTNGVTTLETSGGPSVGTSWLKRVISSAGGSSGYLTITTDTTGGRIPVTPGTKYTGSAIIYHTSSPQNRVSVYAVWRNAAGTTIGTDVPLLTPKANMQWYRVSYTFTAPANAATMAFGVSIGGYSNWVQGDYIGATEFLIEETSGIVRRTNYSLNPDGVGSVSGNIGISGFTAHIPGTGEVCTVMSSSAPVTGAVIRQNLALNPLANSSTGNWATTSVGSSSITLSTSFQTHIPTGKSVFRMTVNTIPNPASSWAYLMPHATISTVGNMVPVVPGDTVSIAATLWSSKDLRVSGRIGWRNSSNTFISWADNPVFADIVGGEGGVGTRLATSGTAPANAAYAYVCYGWDTVSGAQMAVGDWLQATDAITEKNNLTQYTDFFTGSSNNELRPSDITLITAWSGAVNNSVSTQSISIPAGALSPEGTNFLRKVFTTRKTGASTGWATTGTPYRSALSGVAGDSITASVWVRYDGPTAQRVRFRVNTYNAGGSNIETQDSDFYTLTPGQWIRLSKTFTATLDFVSVGWWVYQFGATAGDQVMLEGSIYDVAAPMIESGIFLRDYFSGSTPDKDKTATTWSGTVNNSPSYELSMGGYFDGTTVSQYRNVGYKWESGSVSGASLQMIAQRGWDVVQPELFLAETVSNFVRRAGSKSVKVTRVDDLALDDPRIMSMTNLGQYNRDTGLNVFPFYQNGVSLYMNPSIDETVAKFVFTFADYSGNYLDIPGTQSDEIPLTANTWQKVSWTMNDPLPSGVAKVFVDLEVWYTGTSNEHIGAFVAVQDMKFSNADAIVQDYFDGDYSFARWENSPNKSESIIDDYVSPIYPPRLYIYSRDAWIE